MDLHERVSARLLQHGIRPTAQRLQIGMLVLDRPCHFSAEQLLEGLREGEQQVSKATVYNTLSLFSRSGLIREISVDPVRLMYDSNTEPHHHFYNAGTGELTDIGPEELEICRLPALPRTAEAEGVEVLIRIRSRKEA